MIATTAGFPMDILIGYRSMVRGGRIQRRNLSLTPSRHIRDMTLYAADGSSFSWELAKSAVRGFDASFRAERCIGGEAYSESDSHHSLSRETALGWLRVEAAVRGFDARQIK
jgi:hypothetical protein